MKCTFVSLREPYFKQMQVLIVCILSIPFERVSCTEVFTFLPEELELLSIKVNRYESMLSVKKKNIMTLKGVYASFTSI